MHALKDFNIPRTKQPVNTVFKYLSERFPLSPIETKERHKEALKIFEILLDFKHESPLKEKELAIGLQSYFSTLSLLIKEYEDKTFKFETPSPREMLEYLMEIHGLNQEDFRKEIGAQPVVSRILSGKRELTARHIRALSARFNVSPELFFKK